MRAEVERIIDTLEGWMTDDQVLGEILEAFPDTHERSDIASRLYDLGPWLTEYALLIWPDAAGESTTKGETA